MAKIRAISRRRPKRGRPKKWAGLVPALDKAGLTGGAKETIISDRVAARIFVQAGVKAVVAYYEEESRRQPGE